MTQAWIKHARTLSVEKVIDSTVSEIEKKTACYGETEIIREIILELIEIYAPEKLEE